MGDAMLAIVGRVVVIVLSERRRLASVVVKQAKRRRRAFSLLRQNALAVVAQRIHLGIAQQPTQHGMLALIRLGRRELCSCSSSTSSPRLNGSAVRRDDKNAVVLVRAVNWPFVRLLVKEAGRALLKVKRRIERLHAGH